MAPKQTDPQFKLRIPPDMKEALEAAALKNNRSVSAEILARLAETITYDIKSDKWDLSIDRLNRQSEAMLAEIELLKMKAKKD